MSWDVRWRLRWPTLDRARFESAVTAAAGAHGFEVSFAAGTDPLTAFVKLPRAFVEHHANTPDPLPHDEHFWGQLDVFEYEGHPLSDDGPYEPLVHTLTDGNGDPVGDVQSLCAFGDRVFAAASHEHVFVHTGHAFTELAWPEDYQRSLPRTIGTDGAHVWAGGYGVIFRVDGLELVPAYESDAEWFRFIGGHRGETYAFEDPGIVHARDGERWSVLDRTTLEGAVVALASNTTATYVSAVGHVLVRVERHGLVAVAMPDDIADLWEISGMAVASDGTVWLATSALAIRYAAGTWTRFPIETEIEKVFAVVIADGVPTVLGRTGTGARFDGTTFQPFRFATDSWLHAACAGPDETIFIGGESCVIQLEPRGPRRELVVRSNTSANRDAWGAICVIAQDVANRVGAGPAR